MLRCIKTGFRPSLWGNLGVLFSVLNFVHCFAVWGSTDALVEACRAKRIGSLEEVFSGELRLALGLALFADVADPVIAEKLNFDDRVAQAIFSRSVFTQRTSAPNSRDMADLLSHTRAVHGGAGIDPETYREQYLYVGANFVDAFERVVSVVGRRQLTEEEKEDWFVLWMKITERLGAQDLPTNRDALFTWLADYRNTHLMSSQDSSEASRQFSNLQLYMDSDDGPTFLEGVPTSEIIRLFAIEAELRAWGGESVSVHRRKELISRLIRLFSSQS